MSSNRTDAAIEKAVILLAERNAYTRRLTRTMLINSGVRTIYEASDGAAVLDLIAKVSPDVLILDWDLPVLNGPEVTRVIRSPGIFPAASLPIIMLTELGLRSRVAAAVRLGVHEILVKPVSPKALRERLIGVLLAPRPMVRSGNHYIPMPYRRADLTGLLDDASA